MCIEAASDLSDVESRVRILNEELQTRKLEVEKLRKAKKKKKHNKMREQELSLKKEIEVRDLGNGETVYRMISYTDIFGGIPGNSTLRY